MSGPSCRGREKLVQKFKKIDTMEKKVKKSRQSDTDRALAKVATVNLKKNRTQEPLAEKDEVKQVEENLRRRLNRE
jgi:hypothetical protein